MLPSNTDAAHRVGLSGLSRRGGGSHSTFFPIDRPMCAAAYTQLARQTLALCALGVQPRMRPDVFSCKEPTSKEVFTLEFTVGAVRRGHGSAEGVGA